MSITIRCSIWLLVRTLDFDVRAIYRCGSCSCVVVVIVVFVVVHYSTEIDLEESILNCARIVTFFN